MTRLVYIVSDLHLGGAPGFQMCPPEGQTRLVAFIRWVRAQGAGVDLVLAGDVVDFLAETEDGVFQAFTGDAQAALHKLAAIMNRTGAVWDELAALVADGCALSIMLGNHDIELCFPASRRLLLDRLGPGRVEFVYDNQALAIGPILIEHGNRYDGWNAVRHDSLRHVRSRLSRGVPTRGFPAPPGSELVAQVMNPMKRDHAWVDLLKPETSGVLPLLAFLDPPRWDQTWKTVRQRYDAARVWFDDEREPENPDQIAAVTPERDEDGRFALAHDLAAGGSVDQISGLARPPFKKRWAGSLGTAVERAELELLLRALRAWRDDHTRAFRVDYEEEDYLVPARAHLGPRHRATVYGHTHLAKRVEFPEGVYLNSGTWADLIRVPEEVFVGDAAAARQALRAFADDLAAGDLQQYRRQIPTFARIELDGQRVVAADVRLFDADSGNPSVTTELMRDLFRRAG